VALTTIEPIMQTVQDTVRASLISLGYGSAFQMVEAYPSEEMQPTRTMIVVSMADQSDLDELELGGGLVDEEFTFTFDVLGFGIDAEGKALNIARQIKETFPKHRWIEITDFTASPPAGSGDFMEVRSCTAARIYFANAQVWQEHWHTVTVIIGYESVPS
jgi:hypothetical protein